MSGSEGAGGAAAQVEGEMVGPGGSHMLERKRSILTANSILFSPEFLSLIQLISNKVL